MERLLPRPVRKLLDLLTVQYCQLWTDLMGAWLIQRNPRLEQLILASSSARRADILSAVGCPHETMVAGIDESRAPLEDAAAYVQRLARAKAEAVVAKLQQGLVLGADTVVVVDAEILGQPRDDDDARRMLKLLSGRWHEVLTGIAIARVGHEPETLVDYERTRVRFAELSANAIDWYVGTGEPKGKAGAYAVQGRAALLIEEIQGDYFNIVGLPIRRVYE